MSHSPELDQAVGAAGRALLTLYGLMVAHDIPGIAELRLLLAWPAGMKDAYNGWLAAMTAVVNALGHAEGVQNMSALSEADKTRLAVRAYYLLLDTPVGGDIRPKLLAITGVTV